MHSSPKETHADARTLQRRAQRCVKRGEARKALQLCRENTARHPSGPTFCWLAQALLASHKPDEALIALRQALYCFRHAHTSRQARTVARMILRIDPSDGAARKRAA